MSRSPIRTSRSETSAPGSRPMSASGILNGKRAVIFGAGGSIGAAVATECAAQGAEVFLAGRTKGKVEDLAARIAKAGARAHADAVDALDEPAVNEYMNGIVKQGGRLDVAFTAVGPLIGEYGNTKPATDLTIEEFMLPLTTVVKSHFIVARAAARHMITQHSGVIIFLTGSVARAHTQ